MRGQMNGTTVSLTQESADLMEQLPDWLNRTMFLKHIGILSDRYKRHTFLLATDPDNLKPGTYSEWVDVRIKTMLPVELDKLNQF